MQTTKVIDDVPMLVVEFRGKEYSVTALKAMANQGASLNVPIHLIQDVPESSHLPGSLDTVIVVQSGRHYIHLFGKLQMDQETKGVKDIQAVRMFSTYSLKKALVVNVLAQKQPDPTVITTAAQTRLFKDFERRYTAKRSY